MKSKQNIIKRDDLHIVIIVLKQQRNNLQKPLYINKMKIKTNYKDINKMKINYSRNEAVKYECITICNTDICWLK